MSRIILQLKTAPLRPSRIQARARRDTGLPLGSLATWAGWPAQCHRNFFPLTQDQASRIEDGCLSASPSQSDLRRPGSPDSARHTPDAGELIAARYTGLVSDPNSTCPYQPVGRQRPVTPSSTGRSVCASTKSSSAALISKMKYTQKNVIFADVSPAPDNRRLV